MRTRSLGEQRRREYRGRNAGRRRSIQELATICAGSRHLGFRLDRKSIGLGWIQNRWHPDGPNHCVRSDQGRRRTPPLW